ncbi:hypothetical protein GCM10009633_10170 [Janibacter melonis]|nr:hypothetical protein [Janibacter melonis]MCB5990473.1 hypothetical protein [Janibacter melonis]
MSEPGRKGWVAQYLEDKREPLIMLVVWIPLLAAVLFGGLLLVVFVSTQM